MKREMMKIDRHVSDCCPGHDTYPNETYSSNRSKRARSRDKKVEHQHVRSILKQRLASEIKEDESARVLTRIANPLG